jgi:hypothetical protein
MTLQSSGAISFLDISNEFGMPPGKNLGAYRVSQDVGSLSNLPLDSGIPQSGSISFSDFYGKKLNIVVDLYSVDNYSKRFVARSRYDNDRVVVIGGFRGKPSRSSNTRIIININKIITSNDNDRNNVAVRTGSWDSQTDLEVEIGPDGVLYGSGGKGGKGADSVETPAQDGKPGTSCLGIEYPATVRNRGYIQAGSGGGGGGGWANRTTRTGSITRRRRENRAPGNGGGGGAGYPPGAGGAGGNRASGRNTTNGSAGSAGTLTTGGAGGVTSSGSDAGGAGGAGGSSATDGSNGQNMSIETPDYNSGYSTGVGGAGGARGRAIIIFNNGSGTNISNSGGGSIDGPIVYNTNPT